MKRLLLLFTLMSTIAFSKERVAYFSGGCFWCTESSFEKVEGVTSVISGYSGGDVKSPTYREVSKGGTGHREAVEVHYDDSIVSYDKLLDAFWHDIDPTDIGGQFADRGFSYTTAIFYQDEKEKEIAEKSKKKYEDLGVYDGPIVTAIVKFKNFYPAEDYHQDYYKKNKVRYTYYRYASGRDQYLEKIWGKKEK